MATDRKVNFQIFTELTTDEGLCRAKIQAHYIDKTCANGPVKQKDGSVVWTTQNIEVPSCEKCPALEKIRAEATRQDMD